MNYLERRLQPSVESALAEQSAVGLLGPRQVGKTTLARRIAQDRQAVYFDLENPEDQAVLSDPRSQLGAYRDRLVIIDEVQRMPGLFQILRGLIDEYRQAGRGEGNFLLLGSSSPELLRQTAESLAGRIAYRELMPLDLSETGDDVAGRLWLRGGFPGAWLAKGERASFTWRRDFIRTYLERDILFFDARLPAETLSRLWTMLAHVQGTTFNAARLASALSLHVRTLQRYVDLLVDLLLVRRLPPWSGNIGKRLVRAPRLYLRDSGVAHALLGLRTLEDVLAHPVAGGSWEGFVIENLLAVAPAWAQPFYYRTQAGAEVDLVLEFDPSRRWAIEIKRSVSAPTPSRGFHIACTDMGAARRIVVYGGARRFLQPGGTETIPLGGLMDELAVEAGEAV
ncbi:MAG: ATP-binding protein [Deltaproteobacteria bacterium]|nr:ATP-binding protein [Deltaproteobacteria bacterium]